MPSELVTDENISDYTYEIETFKLKVLDNLPKQCSSCQKWGKRWRPGKTTCSDAGFGQSDLCDSFEFKTMNEKVVTEIKTHRDCGDGLFMFARGDLRKLLKNFGHLNIVDNRVAPALGINLVMKPEFELRQDQLETAHQWLNNGHGIIHAPVGWGKTVVFAWLVSHLKMRTMVLAQETRHLEVVYEGFHRCTNLDDLESESGEVLCGIYGRERYTKKDGSLGWKSSPGKTYPITISTFQALNAERGQKDLQERLHNMFGLVWLEEAHHESAPTFHAVTRSFNSYYRGGHTGTPERKDHTHVAIYDTIGPVTARGTKVSMIPKVKFIDTGVMAPDWIFKKQYWNSSLAKFLANHRKYTDIQISQIDTDLRDGRKVLVMTERKTHARKLKSELKMLGWKVAIVASGEKILEQAQYGQMLLEKELHVIIGTSMVFENWDVPILDCIHLPFPNFAPAREEQMIGRVRRTNVENKPQPLVRVYTWAANSDIAQRVVGFRRAFYKNSGFEFEHSEQVKALHDL